eukprot:gene981-9888_t
MNQTKKEDFEGRFNLIDDCSEKISMNLIHPTFTVQTSLRRNLSVSGTTEMELSLTYFKYLYHFNRIINYLKEKEFEQIPKKFLNDFFDISNYIFENSKPKEWEELKTLFLKMEKPNEKMISTFENIKFQMEGI